MTSKCPKCSMPMSPGSLNCPFCKSSRPVAPVAPATPTQRFRATTSSYQPVTKKDVFLNWLVEFALMVFTLGVGGLIWSLFLVRFGQTPAGKIRDEVFVSIRNGKQASAWKLILRQLLMFLSIVYLVLGLVMGFGIVLDVGGYWIATRVIPGTLLGLMIIDVLFIFTPFKRRLIDWALGIRSVDGGGYSFRSYQPETRGF